MTGLPLQPSRDNSATACELVDETGRELPEHIESCTCPNHTGVCEGCGFKITVSSSGNEYGHGRANNRGPDSDGVRRDCPHRPHQCNPGQSQFWEGYGSGGTGRGNGEGGEARGD